jgi:hypothetical protein
VRAFYRRVRAGEGRGGVGDEMMMTRGEVVCAARVGKSLWGICVLPPTDLAHASFLSIHRSRRLGFSLRSPDENMVQSGDLWVVRGATGKIYSIRDGNWPGEEVVGRRVKMLSLVGF